jgi:signal transduction histidine kinase
VYSLRWRLPFVIVALVGIVLAVFVWITYRQVTMGALQTAGARASVVADQIAGSLIQSTRQRVTDARRALSTPPIEDCLRSRSEQDCERARTTLEKLPGSGPSVTELWTADGTRLLSMAVPATATATMPRRGAPSMATVGALQREGDLLYTEVAVDVRETPAAGSAGTTAPADANRVLGYVLSRRPLAATPSRDLINRLAGVGGSIKLGNTTGDVWTDLAAPVKAPAVDLTRAGVATYVSADRTTYLGALSPIQDTPWALWVEFPQAVVLAPARAFLYRMLLIALACLVAAAAVVAVISARLIGPLLDLTELSEAIASGNYAQRTVPRRKDEVGRLGAALNVMAERIDAMHHDLELRVEQRTASLAEVNQELEAFSYSVSHDLRAPLRHIAGFANLLNQSAAPRLEATEKRHLTTIVDAATRMGQLIDDLLAFSRTNRTSLVRRRVDLARLVGEVRHEVEGTHDQNIAWVIDALPDVEADPALLRVVFTNLLSNAVKYTKTKPERVIEIQHSTDADGRLVVSVKDNGVGFDMAYANKLFGVFQRLHRTDEFEGTGIGLATVRRIIQRHGGRTWAVGALNEGATFSFSLPRAHADDASGTK